MGSLTYMGQYRMPQLTRPLPRNGPQRTTPFRFGQRVIVCNDKVLLKGVILEPLLNLNYDEILRHFEVGVRVEIKNQEDFEPFRWDVSNSNRYVNLCHNRGVWTGHVHCIMNSGDGIELTLREI